MRVTRRFSRWDVWLVDQKDDCGSRYGRVEVLRGGSNKRAMEGVHNNGKPHSSDIMSMPADKPVRLSHGKITLTTTSEHHEVSTAAEHPNS